MARSRNIKPGFFKNDELGDCSIYARVLFAGLWCEADPRGILEDRPKRLKVEILPYDSCDVDALLKELEDHGFIERYTANGYQCVRVVNFKKHQNPHQNEKNSELPESPRMVSNGHSESTPVQVRESPKSNREDSLNTDSSPRIAQTPKPPRGIRMVQEAPEFVEFYNAYPRHQGRDDAWNAWKKLAPNAGLVAEIMAGLFALIPEYQAREPDKVPLPATFLNRGRWKDTPIKPQKTSTNGKPTRGMSNDQIADYVNGVQREQDRDREDAYDTTGRVVERRDHAGENRGLSLAS